MKRFLVPLLYYPAAASAAEPAAVASASNLFQVLFGLLVVLAIMGGLAWILKRAGAMRATGTSPVKIIGGVNVGTRERVVVVEVAGQWIVVGVAPGRVNSLATMPRQESTAAVTMTDASQPNFASWLKKTIEKRNGS